VASDRRHDSLLTDTRHLLLSGRSMQKRFTFSLLILVALAASSCATLAPTATPVPPTATRVPPTATLEQIPIRFTVLESTL